MTAERVQRRLAAILVADDVDYSRLMGADEEGTLAALIAHRKELIEPCVTEHRGRIVKTTGDGILAEFASVVDAVNCAVAFQNATKERYAETPQDQRLEFRIGVNLGDVIVQDDDVYGDGVNVAARLEGLAEPGGIVISGTVQEHTRGKIDWSFIDLGPQQVKNIAEAVHAFRVAPTARSVEAINNAAKLSEKPSIAVLPFTNISGDAEQEYFSDGITEDLITALCRVRAFRVVARNSTFFYKDTSPDIRQVAKDLNARYVIEGSVRRAGDRIRLSAQLIDGANGIHIWAERYDRRVEDIFALQDKLTLTLVGAIEPELGRFEQQTALLRPPDGLTAWEAYQQAMWHLSSTRRQEKDVIEARTLFERTISLDPSFARAYAGYAETYAVNALLGIHEEGRTSALQAAHKAIELDPADAAAHYELGRIHWAERQHDAAISEFKRAIELNPSFAAAHNMIARCLSMSGRAREAIPHVEQALLLSPRDPLISMFYAALAHAHLFLKEHGDALEWAEKSVRQPGAMWPCHAFRVATLAHLDRLAEAQKAMSEMLAFQPRISQSFVRQTLPVTEPSYMDHLLAGLRKAGLPE